MHGKLPLGRLESREAIHLWWIDLDDGLVGEGAELAGAEVHSTGWAGAGWAGLLSPQERERAARFRFARDGWRFGHCRAMLRVGLGWYCGRSPREIAIETGRFGKPFVREGAGVSFNVAHCDGLGVLAFGRERELGVDVEAMHRTVEAMEIAAAYFTREEAALIAAAGTERNDAFLRLWTRKEAVLKAAGCGLQVSLDSVDVTRELVRLEGGREAAGGWAAEWRVLDLAPRAGFAGAIASSPGRWGVAEWQISYREARSWLDEAAAD